MPFTLTELEKTIVFVFMIHKDNQNYIDIEEIMNKFPARQRKLVRKYVAKLEMKKLLEKHPESSKYKITETGQEYGKRVISEGVILPKL